MEQDTLAAPAASPSPQTPKAGKSNDAAKYIKDGKIVVLFKNTGNAPVLKQKKFKLSVDVKFQYVMAFLRKQLRFKPEDSLFLFVNATFSPHPEETVDYLFRCFHDSGKLVINYCSQQAWG